MVRCEFRRAWVSSSLSPCWLKPTWPFLSYIYSAAFIWRHCIVLASLMSRDLHCTFGFISTASHITLTGLLGWLSTFLWDLWGKPLWCWNSCILIPEKNSTTWMTPKLATGKSSSQDPLVCHCSGLWQTYLLYNSTYGSLLNKIFQTLLCYLLPVIIIKWLKAASNTLIMTQVLGGLEISSLLKCNFLWSLWI